MESIFKLGLLLSVIDRVSGPSTKIGQSMAGLRGKAMSLGPVFDKFKTYGLIMTTVGAGLINMMAGAAMATVPTQKALGELSSVGIENLQALEQAGTNFSGKWSGTTKAEFISAAYDIKSGIASLSDEGVAEFTKLAALTGKATKSTTSEMTSLFATGYGIYKGMYENLTDMQFGEVFSAGISASVKNFKTTGSGMSQAISQLGAVATTAKVPLAEQLSILGMLQSTMTGSEAGTKYKAMMQSAAGAGEKLNLQFLDANNQLLGMPVILQTLQKKYGSTLDAMEKMEIQKAFGTQEAVAVIDLLYSKVGDLQTNIAGLSGSMDQGTSFTEQMAATMNKDIGAGGALLAQRMHNLVEVIGNQLIPVLVPLFSWIGNIINGMIAFAGEHETLVRVAVLLVGGVASVVFVLGMLAAILGAVGLLFPNVAIGIGMLGKAVLFMKTGFLTATASVWSFTTALLANPITWVVVAVIALGAALYFLYQKFDSVKSVVNGVLYVLGYYFGVLTKIGNGMVNAFLHPLDTFKSVLTWLKGAIPEFLTSGKALWGAFTNGISSMAMAPVEVVKSGLAKIRNLLPFSDAKEGPLSTLTLSGARMMETIGMGIQSAGPSLAKTAAMAMAGVAAVSIAGAGGPKTTGSAKAFNRGNPTAVSSQAPGKKDIHIHINGLTLSNVNDAGSFVEELQKLAEGHDV